MEMNTRVQVDTRHRSGHRHRHHRRANPRPPRAIVLKALQSLIITATHRMPDQCRGPDRSFMPCPDASGLPCSGGWAWRVDSHVYQAVPDSAILRFDDRQADRPRPDAARGDPPDAARAGTSSSSKGLRRIPFLNGVCATRILSGETSARNFIDTACEARSHLRRILPAPAEFGGAETDTPTPSGEWRTEMSEKENRMENVSIPPCPTFKSPPIRASNRLPAKAWARSMRQVGVQKDPARAAARSRASPAVGGPLDARGDLSVQGKGHGHRR